MTDEKKVEEEKMDAARADSERRMDEKLDMLLKGIDSVRSDVGSCMKRLDAFEEEKKMEAAKANAAKKDSEEEEEDKEKEKEKKDAEEDSTKAKELAADKGRKDSEEEEMKNDAARADAAEARVRDLDRRLEELTKMVRQPIPDSHREELLGAQARADEVLIQLGKRAPQPMVGENPFDYRRRVIVELKPLSDQWKSVKLDSLVPEAFDIAEKQIYADAVIKAKHPTDIPKGRMREVRRTTPAGHTVTEFYSDTHFTRGFSRRPRRVQSIFTGR